MEPPGTIAYAGPLVCGRTQEFFEIEFPNSKIRNIFNQPATDTVTNDCMIEKYFGSEFDFEITHSLS